MIPDYDLGERICVVGKSGSGKTNLCLWLCQNAPSRPVVIFNTKHDPSYRKLLPPGRKGITKDLPGRVKPDQEFVLIEPESDVITDPMALDDMLMRLSDSKDLVILIDESYMFHSNGQAGPGLVGLLTRGRSRGLTTICGTQRPAWVSRFVFSEATKGFFLNLSTADDRKKIEGYTGIEPEDLPKQKYDILFYDLENGERSELFRVPVYRRPVGEELPRAKRFNFI